MRGNCFGFYMVLTAPAPFPLFSHTQTGALVQEQSHLAMMKFFMGTSLSRMSLLGIHTPAPIQTDLAMVAIRNSFRNLDSKRKNLNCWLSIARCNCARVSARVVNRIRGSWYPSWGSIPLPSWPTTGCLRGGIISGKKYHIRSARYHIKEIIDTIKHGYTYVYSSKVHGHAGVTEL